MRKTRVLIVEDEGIVAVTVKVTLIAAGYEVLPIAISAASAIELAGANKPDLALMDIKLRGKADGIDAAFRIWEDFNIPSIFVTAYATEEMMERVRTVKHFGFLEKPVEEWQYKPAIESALGMYRSERRG